MSETIILWLKLFRVKHYVKNLLIFIPLFFAGEFLHVELLFKTLIGFILFSLISSGIYILNDIKDLESDKRHPIKRNRPIAAGKVSKEKAFLISIFMISFPSIIIYKISISAFIWSSIYIILNILYSIYLKKIPILELFIVSSGYPIRLFFGGALNNIYVSKWLVIMVYFATLTLFIGKRLSEFKRIGKTLRKSLESYDEEILKYFLIISSTISIMLYIIYSILDILSNKYKFEYIYITAIPVAYAFFRYIQLAVKYEVEEAEMVLFRDKHLFLSLLIWFITFLYIIYLR